MPTLTITRNYADNTTLTQAELDAQNNSIETFINTTKLDASNIQNAAITSALLANGAVNNAALGSSAVATANIQDNAITGGKLNANVVDNSSLQYASSQLSVKAGGVTQAMLAARATGSTVAAGGVATGSSIGGVSNSYSTTSTSYATITNQSVTITTTGRPVWIGLIPDGPGGASNPAVISAASSTTGLMQFQRGGTLVSGAEFAYVGVSNIPVGPWTLDFPAAGTYTYTAVARVAVSGTFTIGSFKLAVFEL